MSAEISYDHVAALAWGSHLPAMLACIGHTHDSGMPVLELGLGHFSTPALHCLCGSLGLPLISFESDPGWANIFQDKYRTDWHQFRIGPYAEELGKAEAQMGPLNTVWWSVALIDYSPGAYRKMAFERLLPRSLFVVVHDYHREIEEAIKPLLANTADYRICTVYQPPTLVAASPHGSWVPAEIKLL